MRVVSWVSFPTPSSVVCGRVRSLEWRETPPESGMTMVPCSTTKLPFKYPRQFGKLDASGRFRPGRGYNRSEFYYTNRMRAFKARSVLKMSFREQTELIGEEFDSSPPKGPEVYYRR